MGMSVDPTLDVLLDLHDQILIVDPDGGHGERLVGFDNAHPVGRRRHGEPQDHRHRLGTLKSYEYRDAASLLADFWSAVDAVLCERGVIP